MSITGDAAVPADPALKWMLLANFDAPVIEAPNWSVLVSYNWTVELGLMAVAVPSVSVLWFEICVSPV